MKLKITVVGSFPRISNSIKDSIKECVDIQQRHGVDIFSGQNGEEKNEKAVP